MLLSRVRDPARRGVAVAGANALLLTILVVAGPSIVAAVAAVAAAVLVVLQRPQRGILLLAAMAPFDGLLLLAPPIPFMNVWSEGLVVLVLLGTFVVRDDAGRLPRQLPGWVPAIGGLLLLGVASAAVVGGVRGVVGLKVMFFYVLAAVAVWRAPLDRDERDRLVTILMATGGIVAVYGLLQQVVGAEALHQLGYEYNTAIRFTGGWLRSFSTFNQPFGFAFYLMLVVLVGLPHALAERTRLRSQLFLMLLPLFALALLSTFVRASWLGLAAGLAFLGSTRSRLLLFVIPAALVVLLALPESARVSALSTSSSEERVEGWGESLDRVVQSPLGNGIGTTGSAAEKVVELTSGGRIYQPDNYYFKIVYELGPLGLWLLLLFLSAAFFGARDLAQRTSGNDAAFARGVAASILAAAMASLVATYFEIFPLDLLFWILVAVTATMRADLVSRSTTAGVARPTPVP